MLLATEADGSRMLWNPITDPMITQSQKKKVSVILFHFNENLRRQ